MRRILVVALLIAVTGQLFAVDVSSHTVVKGDTLWDIAGKVYENPWHWPKIYDANKDKITDPNMIFPDQELVIPDKSLPCPPPPEGYGADMKKEEPAEAVKEEAVATEEPVAAEAPAAEESSAPAGTDDNAAEQQESATSTEVAAVPAEEAQEAEQEVIQSPEEAVEQAVPESPAVVKKATTPAYLTARSYVVGADWNPDGFITGDSDKKILISAGDTVFINVGSDKVKPGTRLDVIRKVSKVKDPVNRQYVGYEVTRVGLIEVTKQTGDSITSARVIISNEPMKIGDMVKIIAAE